MKTKSMQEKRNALESVAVQVHAGLLHAQQLHREGNVTLSFAYARQLFPLAVWIADRRVLGPDLKNTVKQRPVKRCLDAMRHEHHLDHDQYETLKEADLSASTTWGDAKDCTLIIAAALMILELTESQSCKRRREQAGRAPTRRFSLSTAASWFAGLFGLSAAA
ncbi:hypothetical protein [Crateriforma spongiae]|uniref:hypothetical protein n=1 Tax=Crateriforma spongiae TaxID=2724528 RepID=UPI0039AF7C98